MQSISDSKLDLTQIYYGNRRKFKNAGGIDFIEIVNSTRRGKLSLEMDRGTGKYWIFREEATKTGLSAIKKFAITHKYDLIATAGYLSSVGVPYTDITEEIIKSLEKGR